MEQICQQLFDAGFAIGFNVTNVSRLTPAELGQKIRELRGPRKVDALIEGTGLKREVWSRYENGHGGSPSLERLYEIASALSVPLSQLLGETPHEVHETITIGEDEAIGVPLIARDVAAGHGSFPQPVDARRYFFRADSLRDMIGPGSSRKDRLGVVFLDPRQRFGESMMPTIQPGSMILIDRQVSRVEDRMIYLVEYNDLGEDGALAIKRLTLDAKKRILICESDNPDQAYAPVIIDLQEEGLRWEHVVKGRVILWSTESKPRTPPVRKKAG